MKQTVTGILFIFSWASSLFAQSSTEVSHKRTLTTRQPVYQSGNFQETGTLRMDQGKVWVNGNLLRSEDVPDALENPNLMIQVSFFGSNEFQFSLGGREYLLKHGKIVEIDRLAIQSPSKFIPGEADQSEYFNSVKYADPNLFSSWERESVLHERCVLLSLDYQFANREERALILPQLQDNLSQLFDINLQNQWQEILQMEKDIESLKKELEFRQKNKAQVIQNHLNELIGQ